MNREIRVLIVDDDPIVRSALTNIVNSASGMSVIGACTDGQDAVETVAATGSGAEGADVIVMDVRMPRLGGLDAARTILEQPNPPRIIILTTYDEDDHLLDALELGVSGFLMKDTPPESLVDAISLAFRGEQVMSSRPAQRLTRQYLLRPSAPPSDGGGLGPRELEVLQTLCEAASNAEIAKRLHLSESTVKSYVSSIMTKLGCASRLQTVLRAFELGLAAPPSSRTLPRSTEPRSTDR